MVDVSAGLQSLDLILKGLKALASIREEKRLNDAVIDLQREAIELQRHLKTVDAENFALLQRVRALEAEIGNLKDRSAELERYELKSIGGGATAYMLKPAMRGTEPPVWLCPACYANGKKAILQRTVQTVHGHLNTCGGCGAKTVVGWGEPQWL